MTRKLAIIIPVFSGPDQVRRCLQSLDQSHYRDFDIILVDHGVTDAISQLARDEFPQTICLRGSADLWWSGASNLGITYALESGKQWLMLLNHDCYTEPDTLGTVVSQLEKNSDSIIAPVQHLLKEKCEIAGITSCFLLGFTTLIPPAAWYRFRYPAGLAPTALICGGRGVILSAATIQRVGLLDEAQLPHYGADHDFYFRCRKAGLKLYICMDARVNIDNTMTSSARNGTDLADFSAALKDRGSHRNIKDLRVLFSRYYPIPGLSGIGVAFNTLRFFVSWLANRLASLLKRKP